MGESGGGSTGPPGASTAPDPAQRASAAVVEHCRLALEAAGPECVGVKLQLACFERLGAPGWEALRAVARLAQQQGLLVIADAKRGDIDVTATAYAQAFFGQMSTPFGDVPGLAADALTVNPLLGADSLEPLISAARAQSAGLFVLVRTSNPGAQDVQDLPLAGGGSVSDRLASMVAELGAGGVGSHGLADVGAVVGTAPERLGELRQLMPHAILLVPGVGAQGGAVEPLAPAFAPGRAAALLTVSRAIVDAYLQGGRDPAEAARSSAAALRQAAWSLAD
jgi:orotidine-5'-phosphate decarboxylase